MIVRNHLVKLIAAGIQLSWLYVLLSFLQGFSAGGVLSLVLLLLFYPTSFVVFKIISKRQVSGIYRMTVSWLLWVFLVLVIIKTRIHGDVHAFDPVWLLRVLQDLTHLQRQLSQEFLLILSSSILWWFGQRLAMKEITHSRLFVEFQLGFAVLLSILFLEFQLQVEVLNVTPLIILFFTVSLAGFSLTHMRGSENQLQGLPILYKFFYTLVGMGTVFLIGLGINLIVNPDLLRFFLSVLGFFWDLVIQLLQFINSLFPELDPLKSSDTQTFIPEMRSSYAGGFSIPEIFKKVFRFFFSLFWIMLFLIVFWRISTAIANWLRIKLNHSLQIEFETIPGALKADLILFFKTLHYRLAALFSKIKTLLGFSLKEKVASRSLSSVRFVYRDLLKWSDFRGYQRKQFQTPDEFLTTLVQWLPEQKENLALITQTYVADRYGPESFSKEQLLEIKEKWKQVKRGSAIKTKINRQE